MRPPRSVARSSRCSGLRRRCTRRPSRRSHAWPRSTSNAVPVSSASVRSGISSACASSLPTLCMIWRAALRRERLPMAKPPTPPIFTSPQDAALAFYQAFEAQDIDAMMASWAEDEDIVCVHPGGPRLVGYEAVRAGWEQLFAGDTKLSFRLDEIVVIETVGLALQSAIEHVTLGEEPKPRGAAIATNVFMRTPSGWRLV